MPVLKCRMIRMYFIKTVKYLHLFLRLNIIIKYYTKKKKTESHLFSKSNYSHYITVRFNNS